MTFRDFVMPRVSRLTELLSENASFREGYERAQSYIQIGVALRELRGARRLTQDELAKLAGVDQADISRIENGRWGKRGISYDVLERILPVFGLRISSAVEPMPGTEVTPVARDAIDTMTALLTAR